MLVMISSSSCFFFFFFFFNDTATTEIYTFPTRRSSDLTMGPRLHAAVDRVVAEGRLAQLLDALEAGVADTAAAATVRARIARSEEHTSELQSRRDLVCRLLLEKKKKQNQRRHTKTRQGSG